MSESRRDVARRSLPDLLDWAEGLPGLFGWPQINPRGIRVEEFTRDGDCVIRAELPGIDPERDVKVQVDEGILVIHAERREEHRDQGRSEFRYGTFTRRLPLPSGADEERVTARYESGILEITVPMGKKGREARQIPVQRG